MSNFYDENILREQVKLSHNISDLTRRLGLKNYCGNRNTVKKYVVLYKIDISHFDFKADYTKRKKPDSKPLSDILIQGSTYCTKALKKRLYAEGLKQPICELCGQDEWWYGKKMAMIIDHINGDRTDNRLENLRIICPNCSGTLETNGGKNIKLKPQRAKYFCSCGREMDKDADLCLYCHNIKQRRVARPSMEVLKNDIESLGYCGTGRKYGVSDNAIRKWLKNK